MYTIDRLEKKYGIKVVEDFVSAISGKQLYKMYSADGCPWENGLSLKGLREECEEWEKFIKDHNTIGYFNYQETRKEETDGE